MYGHVGQGLARVWRPVRACAGGFMSLSSILQKLIQLPVLDKLFDLILQLDAFLSVMIVIPMMLSSI